MYSKNSTAQSTKIYWDKIAEAKVVLEDAEAIVIGAGAGLSASAGLEYSGERFLKLFPDFIKEYNLKDMYSAAFYPFSTPEELWGYWSRHIYYNRFCDENNSTYANLLALVKNKNYFVITTNVDHLFILNGFEKSRLFYTQGDYGLFQCSVPCHDKTYDNYEFIMKMVERQNNLRVPTELIPYCPRCNSPMTVNLRKDNTFVQDDGWYKAAAKYEAFLKANSNTKTVYWELGIGYNTPSIIKYPFWHMTNENPNARFITINMASDGIPEEIATKSILLTGDISDTLKNML